MEKKVVSFKFAPFQEKFVLSEAMFPAMVSAWGTGKTLCGISKIVMACEKHPNNLALICRKAFTDLRDSTIKDFETYTGKRVNSDGDVKFSNGSKLMFRHAEQLAKLQNINLGAAMIEQAEEFDDDSQWQMLQGRMRRKGCGTQQLFVIANTNGNNWIKQLWKDNPVEWVEHHRTKEKMKAYELHEATTWDNADNLPDTFLTRLKVLERTKPQVYDQFVMNSWKITSGKIYQMWNEDYHVIPKIKLPEHWECFGAMDTAIASGVFAATIFKISEAGDLVVAAEYYDREKLISEHAQAIKEMLADEGLEPAYWVFDPSAFNRTRENSKLGKLFSVSDELADYGIYGVMGENSVTAGINRVGEYLQIDYSKKHPFNNVQGSPRLFIMDHCVATRREFPAYREVPNKITERGDRKWMPYKKDDHAVDAVRYGIMSRPVASRNLSDVTLPHRFSLAGQEREAQYWRDKIEEEYY